MRFFLRDGPARVAVVLLLGLVPGLAGCSHVDRAVATSPVPDDFHLRHPVALTNARQTLDIFLVGTSAKLDYRQQRDLETFAADYRVNGQGRIRALVPRGGVDPQAAEATLGAVRRALAAASVRGEIEVGTYRAGDPALAAPVRLSFVKLQAKLASRCGDWPEDLASGSNVDGWENRSYYNFGCATQQTLTAQVDDPRDLVRPRAEDAGDVQMRTRAIGAIRVGTDPSTVYSQSTLVPISTVGGN